MVKLCDSMLLLNVGPEYRAVGLHPELGNVEVRFRNKPGWKQVVAGLNRTARTALAGPRLGVQA